MNPSPEIKLFLDWLADHDGEIPSCWRVRTKEGEITKEYKSREEAEIAIRDVISKWATDIEIYETYDSEIAEKMFKAAHPELK
jgi:hypothetical protein